MFSGDLVTRPYILGGVSVSVCVSMRVYVFVFPGFVFLLKISVVSAPIKLKLGEEIENNHILILRKIHNDSFHGKNTSKKK